MTGDAAFPGWRCPPELDRQALTTTDNEIHNKIEALHAGLIQCCPQVRRGDFRCCTCGGNTDLFAIYLAFDDAPSIGTGPAVCQWRGLLVVGE